MAVLYTFETSKLRDSSIMWCSILPIQQYHSVVKLDRAVRHDAHKHIHEDVGVLVMKKIFWDILQAENNTDSAELDNQNDCIAGTTNTTLHIITILGRQP